MEVKDSAVRQKNVRKDNSYIKKKKKKKRKGKERNHSNLFLNGSATKVQVFCVVFESPRISKADRWTLTIACKILSVFWNCRSTNDKSFNPPLYGGHDESHKGMLVTTPYKAFQYNYLYGGGMTVISYFTDSRFWSSLWPTFVNIQTDKRTISM